MTAPLVTIGLPVYNGAEFLDSALASLCAQTFQDLRILVADNASTDETPQIIQKWVDRDPRVQYHRQPENIGAIGNYAWVLDNARTPWFMFGAYDDLWTPDFVERLYKAVTARPGLLCAVPSVSAMSMDGTEQKLAPLPAVVTEQGDSLSRILRLLRKARSGWYYGVYDTAALRQAK